MALLTIFDFDRTIFETGRFVADLLVAITQIDQLDTAHFRSEMDQYNTHEVYDLFEHLHDHGLDPATAQQTLRRLLTGGEYIYRDVSDAIIRAKDQGDVAILTVGNTKYQEFKLSLCPQLPKLPFHVVPYNKGQWLSEQWQGALALDNSRYQRIRLIDDNPVTFEPIHSNHDIELIQIVRPDARYPMTPLPSIRVIRSLTDL